MISRQSVLGWFQLLSWFWTPKLGVQTYLVDGHIFQTGWGQRHHQLQEGGAINRAKGWGAFLITPPKTNSSPLKNDAWTITFHFQTWFLFSVYVKLGGVISYDFWFMAIVGASRLLKIHWEKRGVLIYTLENELGTQKWRFARWCYFSIGWFSGSSRSFSGGVHLTLPFCVCTVFFFEVIIQRVPKNPGNV